jgi:site-specific DNA-methyltransferase (adenine-specific)
VDVVTIGDATLYHGDCLEVLPTLPRVDAVVTDPPYPNAAGHFDAGIAAANEFLRNLSVSHAFVFWDEMTTPECSLPLVARHIWHRTNTNRPDNYEAIYEYNADERKRPSRVFPFAVIAVGLTGCTEASGHPTQKNTKLIEAILRKTEGAILDPFMGSGTTGVACANLGRKFIGIEIERKYFDSACERIAAAYAQGRLFA